MRTVKNLNDDLNQNGKVKWGVFGDDGELIATRRNKSDALRLITPAQPAVGL